jgi:hypothetical protein
MMVEIDLVVRLKAVIGNQQEYCVQRISTPQIAVPITFY